MGSTRHHQYHQQSNTYHMVQYRDYSDTVLQSQLLLRRFPASHMGLQLLSGWMVGPAGILGAGDISRGRLGHGLNLRLRFRQPAVALNRLLMSLSEWDSQVSKQKPGTGLPRAGGCYSVIVAGYSSPIGMRATRRSSLVSWYSLAIVSGLAMWY